MYSVDGKKPVDLDLLPGQKEIDLAPVLQPDEDEEVGNWDQVTIYGRLTIPEKTVNDVFPVFERDSPPAKLYVAIRCHDTIYRDRAMISEAPTGPGTYDVSVMLEKDDIRGTVELCPYLVRTEDRSGEKKYAAKSNLRLASCRDYRIIVDRPKGEEPPAIDGEEASFSRTAYLPDGDKLYYLDFRNESRPKLWINSDHPRITDILQSRGSVGAEPRMRDVVLDQISYGVWTQLLIHAGTAIDDNGDVEYEWQETILETFARNLYDVEDLAEATRMLRDEIDDPGSLPFLMERIDRELQEYIDPRTQLINLMEEGLRI
ncbi:hypothetical protein [Halosimplex litoreum]|nr:hypothetical protein [Halosimplex litoreum]